LGWPKRRDRRGEAEQNAGLRVDGLEVAQQHIPLRSELEEQLFHGS